MSINILFGYSLAILTAALIVWFFKKITSNYIQQ